LLQYIKSVNPRESKKAFREKLFCKAFPKEPLAPLPRPLPRPPGEKPAGKPAAGQEGMRISLGARHRAHSAPINSSAKTRPVVRVHAWIARFCALVLPRRFFESPTCVFRRSPTAKRPRPPEWLRRLTGAICFFGLIVKKPVFGCGLIAVTDFFMPAVKSKFCMGCFVGLFGVPGNPTRIRLRTEHQAEQPRSFPSKVHTQAVRSTVYSREPH